ncbi:uncharacterized protein LOC117345029 [Pecten maximus]|uniref:uncharacterized protein LOC117345029 n=1 Tax=Pecten maximus TaxID=6579 RepID=UPI001457F3BA|nr:uncharacterized protein LOC117345029 [Pecten maximus]
MFGNHQIFVILGLLCVSKFTDAILCYGCATSDEDDPCLVNWKGLKKNRIKTTEDNELQPNVKNCTGDRPYCVIEETETRGSLVAFIRDCSDGKTFSVPVPNFRTIIPDNQTECGYNGGYLSCIRLCAGEFCNGPSTAAGVTPNTVTLLLLFQACFLYKMLIE